jgi:hypothetical protein
MATILGAVAGVTIGALMSGFSFAGGAQIFHEVINPPPKRMHDRIEKNVKKEKQEAEKQEKLTLKELEEAIK